MNRNELIIITEEFVKENLKGYDSGHDWWHIERVRGLARHINMIESLAEPFTVEITALLHDSADSKFSGEDCEAGYTRISEFMEKPGLSEIKEHVIEAIRSISFSSKYLSDNPSDPLLQVIQDADRLDAIGAVGIARAFNYGGFRNNAIYNPGDESGGRSTIGHFYEKLLLLKGMMNTETAKKLAVERHEYLEMFLDRFYKEWKFAIA
jgi:uncharacterized protein